MVYKAFIYSTVIIIIITCLIQVMEGEQLTSLVKKIVHPKALYYIVASWGMVVGKKPGAMESEAELVDIVH